MFFILQVGTGQEVVESLPSSLFDVATAMLDRLDPTEALVVKVASVVGDVFTADTLLQVRAPVYYQRPQPFKHDFGHAQKTDFYILLRNKHHQ